MKLVTGPAGSGKTKYVLERLREALRARDNGVRLLVPTATLEHHLQNRIAREGFVLRPEMIQTLSRFVEKRAGDRRQVSNAVFYLVVQEAVRRVGRPEFARVAQMPGFSASMARTMDEFASAGCDSARLAGCLPDTPLSAAFLAVYREVDRELERRRLATRARRLQTAAGRIREEGLGEVTEVLMDGFHALPDPELSMIEAIGRHAAVTLTLDAMDPRLAAMGFVEERRPRPSPRPAVALVRAASIEREVEEIARRIVEQAAGRPFREIGIIVRSPDLYVPVLRATLERFAIPARFYFDQRLDEHPVVRFLCGVVAAVMSGWDYEAALEALRLAPGLDDGEMDRFDFAVRERIPAAGIEGLKSLSLNTGGIASFLEDLTAFQEWLGLSLSAADWAARLRTLRTLFRPAIKSAAIGTRARVQEVLRPAAPVLKLFDQALDEAAEALDREAPMSLAEYWRVVKSVLRIQPLRLEDRRRNVVHVVGAHEARQWVLPVVFVCGMVEKQFPKFHTPDPYFPEAARRRLYDAGVRVRRAEDTEAEERALFDSAMTRATLLVTLSYPEFDARGDRTLPSLYLEDLLAPTEDARPVRPQPRRMPAPPTPAEIRAPELLAYLRQRTARISPTALESFLQCPFQFFGGKILRLRSAPLRPEERFDFLTQGSIVHEVLAAWWPDPKEIEPLFEGVFNRYLLERRIPQSYHTERLRNAMLADLQAFTSDQRWPRDSFDSSTEREFKFPLNESLVIAGKMDRLDVGPGERAYVIDYKYSRNAKNKAEDFKLLQAPLYLLAAQHACGLQPAGMFYIGLKGDIVYAGWSDAPIADINYTALSPQWLDETTARVLHAVDEIRGGRIAVEPAEPADCRFCDYRDVCRVEARRGAAVAEGA